MLLSQTLQAVFDVEGVLTEMLRIGRSCIVSIPNFAYRPLRRMLAEQGRAPKSGGVLHRSYAIRDLRRHRGCSTLEGLMFVTEVVPEEMSVDTCA